MMPLALVDLYLALEFKGFSHWEPRTKAITGIVGVVILLVFCIALIRRVGLLAIIVPVVIFGAIYVMNQNAGCMSGSTDANKLGTYDKEKARFEGHATPPPGPVTPPGR